MAASLEKIEYYVCLCLGAEFIGIVDFKGYLPLSVLSGLHNLQEEIINKEAMALNEMSFIKGKARSDEKEKVEGFFTRNFLPPK